MSKPSKPQPIPPHIHCHLCGREIAPRDVRPGQTLAPIMTSNGPSLGIRTVPICARCEADLPEAPPRPTRLIVPKPAVAS